MQDQLSTNSGPLFSDNDFMTPIQSVCQDEMCNQSITTVEPQPQFSTDLQLLPPLSKTWKIDYPLHYQLRECENGVMVCHELILGFKRIIPQLKTDLPSDKQWFFFKNLKTNEHYNCHIHESNVLKAINDFNMIEECNIPLVDLNDHGYGIELELERNNTGMTEDELRDYFAEIELMEYRNK